MKTLSTKLAGLFLAAALVLTGWSAAIMKNAGTGEQLGGGVDWFNVATSGFATVQTSSTLVQATTSHRTYMALVNDGANVVYCNLQDQPAVANSGVRLNAAGGTWEFTQEEGIYKGAVRCIASGGTSVVTVFEGY